ncbi:hypothetical protein [Paramicrobacterium chengjingii]|uniref:DNA polymerase III subunit gamma/tau n=1 Tax=Paramicrobacterium chengjingii TaxID=2769067 RepID=A0ABX6YLT3_9MICO|nr:hypothetical protein [Microbacterium chengjingii]QPZ39756.1 hypothetical protein HCR76_06885 [Microbacterium chengjingii]
MSRDRDDDPLSWAGDDDPTLQTHASGEPVTKKSAQNRTQRSAPASAAEPAQQPGSAMLVVLGVLGGVYLLYTVGWALNIGRDTYAVASPIDQIMYTVGLWLAAAAAPLWFAVALWFTRGHTKSRILWLVLGAVVLIPWPFVIGGL